MTTLKQCKWCKEDNPKHWPYQCRNNPKMTARPLKRFKAGKVSHTWQRTREIWFRENYQDSYNCFYCGRHLWIYEVTLDHYLSRSRHPELRYDLENLRPSCALCNYEKGSIDGDIFVKRYKEQEAE